MSQCNTNETLRTFIVVRHGSNGANQPRHHRMVLGSVVATDADVAKRIAGALYTCYNNQSFEVIDMAGRTRREDREAAAEADVHHREVGEYFDW